MAAQYGVATFATLSRPRQTFNVQFYLDDTAGNAVLWDTGGGDAAKGQEEWRPPVPVALLDFVIAAAATPLKTAINRSNQRIATLLNAVQLASVVVRPPLSLLFDSRNPISGNQLA